MATLVDLTAAKAHVRRTDNAEDAIIGAYLAAAIQWVSNYTGHVLASVSVVDAYEEWGPFLTLRYQPIAASPVPVVEYVNTDGDTVELTDFILRDEIYPWTIYPDPEFPPLGDGGNITVTYTAGYASGQVPDALNMVILLLVAHWYTLRSPVQDGQFQEVPLAVMSLCRPYRGAVMA